MSIKLTVTKRTPEGSSNYYFATYRCCLQTFPHLAGERLLICTQKLLLTYSSKSPIDLTIAFRLIKKLKNFMRNKNHDVGMLMKPLNYIFFSELTVAPTSGQKPLNIDHSHVKVDFRGEYV